jgi:hypothetical protein
MKAGGDEDSSNGGGEKKGSNNPLDFFLNPYESKIPKEIEAEIYEAEANTPAAQNRGRRVALYSALAVAGVMAAFFNAFLSELRAGPPEAGMEVFDLSTSAFAWAQSNPVFGFLFLNKIGGGIALLAGCGSGLMAEAELDGRRINAERIWDEMQRRCEASERRSLKKQERQQKQRAGGGTGRSSLGKKKAKRLSALSEVAAEPKMKAAPAATDAVETPSHASSRQTAVRSDQDGGSESPGQQIAEGATAGSTGGGLFGGVKDLYAKADSMAASQALLLNKRLEDAGLIDKITDETGLKVIGKQQASAAAAAGRASEEEALESKPTTPKPSGNGDT